jgi:hypothetical protein
MRPRHLEHERANVGDAPEWLPNDGVRSTPTAPSPNTEDYIEAYSWDRARLTIQSATEHGSFSLRLQVTYFGLGFNPSKETFQFAGEYEENKYSAY